MHPVRRPLRVASATGCGFRVENDPKLYERLDCVVLHGPFGENPSTLAYIGALAGAALGQLGATYLVLFLAMLGIGILQDPMFGDGTPGELAYAFPDYGAGRVSMNGAFSAGFHAWTELALALGWLAVLGTAVTWVLRRLLRSTA